MENNELDQRISYIYSSLYRGGMYGANAVAFIGQLLKRYFIHFSEFSIENMFKYMSDRIIIPGDKYSLYSEIKDALQGIDNFSFREIAAAYRKLIDDKLKKTDAMPTEDYYVNFMQAFILFNDYDFRRIVDPCVGTGQLLRGLDEHPAEGFDIDQNYTDIADAFLYFYNNENKDLNNIKLANSLETDEQYTQTFFIMDPPLGTKLNINSGNLFYELNNFIYTNNPKIASEYLFLAKALFNNDNCRYACLVPSNFLTAKDRFKQSFRKFLYERSIDVVVTEPLSNRNYKIILYGHDINTPNFSDKIYFITPKTNHISKNKIEEIIKLCIHNGLSDVFVNMDNFVIETRYRKELLELDNHPQTINVYLPPKIEPLEKIINSIKALNEQYHQEVLKFEEELDKLTHDVIRFASDEITPKRPKNEPWFKKEQNDIEKLISRYTNKSSNWHKIEQDEIDLYALNGLIKDYYKLFNENRLKIEDLNFLIYSKKEKPSFSNTLKFWEAIYEQNLKDENIVKKLNMLSDEQKEIYKALIHFHYEPTDEVQDKDNKIDTKNDEFIKIFNPFSESLIFSTINTLKILNLLYELPDIDNTFEKYLPYTPLIKVTI